MDGNDPDAVYAVARAAIERARGGRGPSLIEAKTYRHSGHSRADPGAYRPEEEVAAWLARDPVPMYRERLVSGGVPEADVAAVDREAEDEVDRITEEAKAAPVPEASTLETQVWADGGSSWRN